MMYLFWSDRTNTQYPSLLEYIIEVGGRGEYGVTKINRSARDFLAAGL